MKEFPIYIAGQFIKTDRLLIVNNPYDNSEAGRTWLGGSNELEKAIISAQIVLDELRTLPSFKKYSILMQIADQINILKHEFAEILCRESAKPLKYATAEVERAIQTFIIAAEESKRLPYEYISLDWTPAGYRKEGLIRYFPIGLVAGISPFNFPLNLAVHKIAPAIASGCPIVLKPSSSTPLSTLKLAQIIDKTDMPKGSVSIIPMDRQTGNQLVTDERFKLLTFTGSPEVGWKMKMDAVRKKIVLELGGNAGVIVTESANLELAAQKCLAGGFSYSGQVCIHAQRIYVHEQVFYEFSDNFIRMVEKLKPGNPLEPDTDISVMIDEDNAQRVERWVEEALGEGAQILTGGKRQGSYFQPTVISHSKAEMKVCALEVFGPVVILESYRQFDQAVGFVNQGRFGLQAGVFTNNLDEMNEAFEKLMVGGVIINDVPTFRVDQMPYGGIKDSGLGREGVKYTIRDMMEAKLLVKNF
jgi:glyceraldehyde-3-phosphate dehydrogenase (NADP+)